MAVNIFLAYARKDELSITKLESSLTRILQEDSFSIHKCEIGQINREDDLSLSTADLILLLVSPDFLDSDYCYRAEMAQAMERHKQNEAYIIPLILRPVYWGRTPFSQLQALPENAKPIALSDDQEATFGEIALAISTIVRNKGMWKESDESRKDKKEMPTTTYRYPTLRILALGEPTVFLNEVPVTRWRMARAMELFFFLLESGRPMRKEQIITALWPEVEMNGQIDQTFRATIYYLRKALANADEELRTSVIISQGGTYSLNLSTFSGGVQYDVAQFEEQYKQAKQFLMDEAYAAAKEALLTMVQLYQGDYVQPFYSDWALMHREKLRLIYLDARQQLAQIAWQAEEFDESIEHWQRILAINNCSEEAYYGLMCCYLHQERRAEALHQYERCVYMLQAELGLRPGQAIQNLYEALLSGQNIATAPMGADTKSTVTSYRPSQPEPVTEPSGQSETIKVLFVLSRLRNYDISHLTMELNAIHVALLSREHKRIQSHVLLAATANDLRHELLKTPYQIVHIAGHGISTGFMLEDEQKKPYRVSLEALVQLFANYHQTLRCVILNACYPLTIYKSTLLGIPYVIAMSSAIQDQTAVKFSRCFYDAIDAGTGIERAYHEGLNLVRFASLDLDSQVLLLSDLHRGEHTNQQIKSSS